MPTFKNLSQLNSFQLNKITTSLHLERKKEENKVLIFSLFKFKRNKMSSCYPIGQI